MKKLLLTISMALLIIQPAHAWDFSNVFHINAVDSDERAVKKVLNSQVKFANKTDFDKFISTYDKQYVNSDGFNLEIYSNLVKDIWKTYDSIKYGIKIKNISIDNDKAVAELTETSYAEIPVSEKYTGELKSESNSVYYLKKTDGEWKVISDSIIDETTTMLYGEARDLDIKLTVPTQISADTEYSAMLEFTPPKETYAIASLASDKVEYPQKPAKEVYRVLPEDNILERLFTSNNDNVNEYVIATIGLTKAAVEDLNLKLSLTGFGYAIKRVNVIPQNKFITPEENKNNDESK